MRINERRQMAVLAELADEHEVLPEAMGGGVVAFMPGAHWLCGAIGCGLDAPLTPEGALHAARFVADRGGRGRVDLTDRSGTAALAAVAAAGLVLDEVEHVLARELGTPHAAAPAPGVPGLRFERLDPTDPGALRAHAVHTVAGFARPGTGPTEHEIEAAARSQAHPRSRGFFAMLDGELAGTCGMEVVELAPAPGREPIRVASLWGAVVGERFRRRGVQRAMIDHRLGQGAAEGCTLALIECDPGIATERNAARTGFALAYARLCFRAPA